jgi:hypothetical protein
MMTSRQDEGAAGCCLRQGTVSRLHAVGCRQQTGGFCWLSLRTVSGLLPGLGLLAAGCSLGLGTVSGLLRTAGSRQWPGAWPVHVPCGHCACLAAALLLGCKGCCCSSGLAWQGLGGLGRQAAALHTRSCAAR